AVEPARLDGEGGHAHVGIARAHRDQQHVGLHAAGMVSPRRRPHATGGDYATRSTWRMRILPWLARLQRSDAADSSEIPSLRAISAGVVAPSASASSTSLSISLHQSSMTTLESKNSTAPVEQQPCHIPVVRDAQLRGSQRPSLLPEQAGTAGA